MPRSSRGSPLESACPAFPLGVGASIVTLIVLLRHGAYASRRGMLQGVAILVLFVSGLLATLVGEPLVREIERVSTSGSLQAIFPLFERWGSWHRVELGLSLAVLALLLIAQRQPAAAVAETSAFGLTPRHRTLLFLLGTATLFQGYDHFIASMALPYIGRDLGASQGTLGLALSAIRVGALVSIVFGRVADRRGRRGMLLVTIVAYTLATAATGLSRGITDFVVLQLLAQIFLVTELSVAQVVITEEFPVAFRSLGQGLLGTFGALGAGLAAVFFPLFQATPLGWRGLYFVGIAPLLLTAYLRRSLPETARWHDARRRGETLRARVSELVSGEMSPRFVCLLAMAFAVGCAASPGFGFASYRATEAFGWSPAEVSAMVLFGGGLGMAGWFCWGLLAEADRPALRRSGSARRHGRRNLALLRYPLAGAGVRAARFHGGGRPGGAERARNGGLPDPLAEHRQVLDHERRRARRGRRHGRRWPAERDPRRRGSRDPALRAPAAPVGGKPTRGPGNTRARARGDLGDLAERTPVGASPPAGGVRRLYLSGVGS